MSSKHFGAEKKFWGSPELIATVLPFLDLESTHQLAQAQRDPSDHCGLEQVGEA